MNEIFVTGHRNPDTDSIVASLSYAALRNALGDREYVAARIGSINDETARMLERFGFEAPLRIHNMRTQVCDLDFDRPPALRGTVTMDLVWHTMRDTEISTLPIVDEDGRLCGLLSAGDVAGYGMQTITQSRIDELPVFNLLSVLEGQLVNENSFVVETVSGEVRIGVPQSVDDPAAGRDCILICGDQPELIARALEAQINCLIICQSDIRPEWARSTADTCIVSTPLDARTVARLIYLAIPAGRVCQRENIVSFHLSDYLDDVREILLKSRFRAYPVLDENERVVGTLSRFHLLKPRRKRVVLVDHNEASQSVPGLEQVEIMEIIDHHRLADIQTAQPISVRNEPVGSTNTIITAMYQEYGVMPSPKMAGLMAAAILSDTVMFKSPTCTKRDVAMAERLARIAHVSLEEIGRELFSVHGAEEKPIEELFGTDYKVFHIAEHNIGVSQITCADASGLLARSAEFAEYMQKLKADKDFDFVILMITDVLQEGSHLLYVGSDEEMRQAFGAEPKNKSLFLPGVMSRKKQIIPMLTALWG
jgi:manganese-dependent inorganic pyrophosphatase